MSLFRIVPSFNLQYDWQLIKDGLAVVMMEQLKTLSRRAKSFWIHNQSRSDLKGKTSISTTPSNTKTSKL